MSHAAPDLGRLPGIDEVLIAPSVVTEEEQSILVRWAKDERRQGRLVRNPRDPATHLTPFLSVDGGLTRLTDGRAEPPDALVWVPEVDSTAIAPVPEVFWKIRARVVDLLGLQGLPEDHYKGSFLSYIEIGGEVKTHRDERVRVDGSEYLVLRCNVLFQKPEEGGHPVIAGAELNIPERGMWAFYATELVHSAGDVRGSGSRARATLSFGFLVEEAQLWQREFTVTESAAVPNASPDELTARMRSFVTMHDREFSIVEAAKALDAPESAVSMALGTLQQAGVVRSRSSHGPGVVALLLSLTEPDSD